MLINGALAHFFVDALCAATLFGNVGADMTTLLLLYNTIAFSTQCLVGLAMDKLGRQNLFAALGCALVVLGYLLPLPQTVRVLTVAAGNSVFHVAGGTLALSASKGRAAPLGVFVAPGALGLIIGTLYPRFGKVIFILLGCSVGDYIRRAKGEGNCAVSGEKMPPAPQNAALISALLLLAVAARAIGGTAVSFPWKTSNTLSIALVGFVFAGKLCGGFICDVLGAKKAALLSIPAAAVLIAFGSGNMYLSFLGQFLLNISMPITLYLLYKALPDSPGFAFGLAASVLWPGTIIGQLMTLTGLALWACVIVSFIFGLAAIIYAAKGEKHA